MPYFLINFHHFQLDGSKAHGLTCSKHVSILRKKLCHGETARPLASFCGKIITM